MKKVLGIGILLATLQVCAETPSAMYDQGCHAYEQGNYAQAVCLWQRACLQGNNEVSTKATANCLCAYKKLGIEEVPATWWQKIQRASSRLPLLLVQICFLLVLYGALFFVYRGRRRRMVRWGMASMHLVLLGVVSFLLINTYSYQKTQMGVVVQDQQVLYAGPGNDYPELAQMPCGSLVELCDLRGEWYKVKTSVRGMGWLPRTALMSVRP